MNTEAHGSDERAIQTVEIPAGAARILEQAGNWELWEIQPRRGGAGCFRARHCLNCGSDEQVARQ